MPLMKPVGFPILNRNHSLSRGLVGAWIMNEGAGGKIFDRSGFKNHGTLTNMDPATDWVRRNHGYALKLTAGGSTEYINVPFDESLNLPAGWTVECWFSATSTGTNQVLCQKNINPDDRNYSLIIDFTNGNVIQGAYHRSGSAYYTTWGSVDVADDKWHHAVIVHTNDDHLIVVYVDGINDTTGSSGTPGQPIISDERLFIGTENETPPDASGSFNGKIGKISIYGRSLNAVEVRSLYLDPYQMFRPTFDANIFKTGMVGNVGALLNGGLLNGKLRHRLIA